MRLANVNDEERYLSAKTLIQGFEVPSLGTKGRSSKAPEDQGDRLMVTERGETYALVTAESRQVEIWRLYTDHWGVGLALGNECQQGQTPLWVHTTEGGLQPLPVRRGQVLVQHR
jgi:hypothetical protein